jgi:hypothetical protein
MIKKCILVFMQSTIYYCATLMKLEFSQQIFERSSNIKFYENPSSGNRLFLCGRTGGRTDMTNVIVAFRNFANAPKTPFRARNVLVGYLFNKSFSGAVICVVPKLERSAYKCVQKLCTRYERVKRRVISIRYLLGCTFGLI